VRAPPICRKPVGDGAKRVTTCDMSAGNSSFVNSTCLDGRLTRGARREHSSPLVTTSIFVRGQRFLAGNIGIRLNQPHAGGNLALEFGFRRIGAVRLFFFGVSAGRPLNTFMYRKIPDLDGARLRNRLATAAGMSPTGIVPKSERTKSATSGSCSHHGRLNSGTEAVASASP
jgi:hypothetical protein